MSYITSLNLWDETTAIRIDRNRNRENLIAAMQVAGLVMMYEQAAGADYATQNEISETRESLENEYNRLMQDAIINKYLIQSKSATRNAVERVRRLALSVLERKQQQSFILTDINQPTAKSSLLVTYNLYAEEFLTSDELESKRQVVRGLNPNQKSNALFGDVTVTQGTGNV